MYLFDAKIEGSPSQNSRTSFGPNREEGRLLTLPNLSARHAYNNQYCSPPESNASSGLSRRTTVSL